MTDHFCFGGAQIFRIVETQDAGDIIQRIVPAMTAAAIRPYAARFPACANGGHVLAPVQSFLLFADGRRILIDTGIAGEVSTPTGSTALRWLRRPRRSIP